MNSKIASTLPSTPVAAFVPFLQEIPTVEIEMSQDYYSEKKLSIKIRMLYNSNSIQRAILDIANTKELIERLDRHPSQTLKLFNETVSKRELQRKLANLVEKKQRAERRRMKTWRELYQLENKVSANDPLVKAAKKRTSVEVLHLPANITWQLRTSGITTVEELCTRSSKQLSLLIWMTDEILILISIARNTYNNHPKDL